MKGYFGPDKPTYLDLVKGWEGVTGILMVILMAVAFTLATRWFRRSLIKLPKPFDRLTGFNAFWYSHHLFFIVYVLLVIHGIFLYLEHRWYRKTVSMNDTFLLILCLLIEQGTYFFAPTRNVCWGYRFIACRLGCILLSQFYYMLGKGPLDSSAQAFTAFDSLRFLYLLPLPQPQPHNLFHSDFMSN